MKYHWKSKDWTIPLYLTVGRTLKIGETPVKPQLEFNDHVERPDAPRPRWMVGLNVTPDAPKFIETWIESQ